MSKISLHYNTSRIFDDLNKIDSDQLIFVWDENIEKIYGEELRGMTPENSPIWVCPNGEDAKSIEAYERGVDFFLDSGIHRGSHLVAIGGGAVSDSAGFMAATLLRGINWSVVPTSLLSMIDAAIGGKVGLNSRRGKNLIGAFHFPKRVFINPNFLSTLPNDELVSGKGELIKYAYLDEELGQLLEKNAELDDLIYRCANYKQEVVSRDAKESGERKKLNLGHTIGHAIEKIYEVKHGVAVYWGMVLIAELLNKEDILTSLEKYRMSLLGEDFLPPWGEQKIPLDQVMDFLSKDKKKASNSEIDLIVPHGLGETGIMRFEINDLKTKMSSLNERYC